MMKRFKYILIGVLIGLILSVGLGYSSKMQDLVVCKLLKTGQTTCYAIFDDGDLEKGGVKSYTVYIAGQFAGTSDLDVAHYAANTISFVAPSTINDAGLGFVTFLAGGTIRVRGSPLNSGVYTVAVGGVAGSIVVNEITIVNEAAGAYVTLYKREAHSNNAVVDNNTSLTWSRYVSAAVGSASTGTLNWYDAATCFVLHPAAGDLAIVAGNILRVTGIDESARYFSGMVLDCAGFANAVNNLPGLVVVSVVFAGGNTDIVVNPGKQTLIAEVAGGARAISVVCQSIFSYAAAANTILMGGYGDWRVANLGELESIINIENANGVPDIAVFPSFPEDEVWTNTTLKNDIGRGYVVRWGFGGISGYTPKTAASTYIILVRGG